MTASGFIIFMPWVTLPSSVRIGRFRFCPLPVQNVKSVIDPDMVPTVENVLKCYVRKNGRPIESCTIVLRARHQQAWNIPREYWNYANTAAKSGLQIGGMRFKDIVSQRPSQIEGTECSFVNDRLLTALKIARRLKAPCASAIDSSLEVFLLANSETPELDLDSCAMLSAIAFERLLEPTKSSAQALASALAQYWEPFSKISITRARRIRPDAKFASEQQDWPLHQKWMKELYEARSAAAHRGIRPEFSRNWTTWQHLVIAAFVYPLTVKLRLAEEGLYILSNRELGACEAIDELLDSNWGTGWRKPPEWSKILSHAEAHRDFHAAIMKAIDGQKRPRARDKNR